MEFPRQEYWSGLPFPPPGDLPDPRTESTSPVLSGGFFTTETPGKPIKTIASYSFYFVMAWSLEGLLRYVLSGLVGGYLHDSASAHR